MTVNKIRASGFTYGVFFVICVFLINLVFGDQSIGDSCTANGKPGTCKLLLECQSALNDLKFKGIRPTVCGYMEFKQIACCPNPSAIPQQTVIPLSAAAGNSKKVQKCKEYSSAVYENVNALLLTENANTITRRNDRCGHTAVPLVVGGLPASPREFPHSTLLGYPVGDGSYKWDCGGSLVSPKFVLTAGHCLKSRDYGPVKRVRLGDLNLLSDTDDARPEEVDVAEAIAHPDYSSTSKYHDIGLLRLSKVIKINPYIRPICLPVGNEQYRKAIATGWGAVEWSGRTSNTLLAVTLEIFTQAECNETYAYNINRKLNVGIVETTQLCAGSRTEKRDTCQGDSGGPLQIYHSPDLYCMYTQVGITSFGSGCGTVNVPGVYTRLTHYVDWIEGVVWPDDNAE